MMRIPETRKRAKKDGRKSNRGVSTRRQFTMQQKMEILARAEEFQLQHGGSFQMFFDKHYGSNSEAVFANFRRWVLPAQRFKIEAAVLDGLGLKAHASFKKGSPFQEVEANLYKAFELKRRKGHKVSNKWIRIEALRQFKSLQDDSKLPPDLQFKASYGWCRRFMNRRGIKYRKRKSGKSKSANEHIPKFEEFLARLRFQILPPRDPGQNCHPIWGRFPPELRYNMDQVPCPFVVNQDTTFTDEGDEDVHIRAPSDSLRKRQFTLHCVLNAGVGEKAHAWVELVCNGTGTRISRAEKNAWNEDVEVFWQKKAWVDKYVMREIAEAFVRKKKMRHGDLWVLLFCDNLKAHLDAEVKRIFGEGRVLLCYFPPAMTEVIQPIDAGYGRSLRSAIGQYLDEWLMSATNMERWESNISAMERRVLMTHLVDRAQKWILDDDQDKLRVGCFERTGLLLTWQQNLEKDKLVRPQGMTAPFRIPTRAPDDSQELPESAEMEALAEDVDEADSNSDDDDEEQHTLDDIEVDDMEVLMEDEDDSDENEEEDESEDVNVEVDEDSSDDGEEDDDESKDMNVEMTRSSRGRVITARRRFGVEG